MAKSSVSTLSSTIRKSHHHHHHHHRQLLSRPQLSPGSVESIDVTEDFGPKQGHICGRSRRPYITDLTTQHNNAYRNNVAIATQVISPSAIGGSLKISGRRTLSPRYDPEGDNYEEDRGLFPRRKRIPWGKLTCYGVSIGIIVLLLTGVILAVGYMQSEKQRILSQSQRLSQEPSSDINLATTWRPKIIWETVTSNPVENVTTTPVVNATSTPVENATSRVEQAMESPNDVDFEEGSDDEDEDDDEEDDDEEDSKELEIYEPLEQPSRKSEIARMDETNSPLSFTVLTRSSASSNQDKYNENNKSGDEHRSPSEVKVLPPQDFFTKGFSIGIPIYNETVNKKDHNGSLTLGAGADKTMIPASIPFQILPSIGFPLDLNLTSPTAIPELNFSLPDPQGSPQVNLIIASQKFGSEDGGVTKAPEAPTFSEFPKNWFPTEESLARSGADGTGPTYFSAKISSPKLIPLEQPLAEDSKLDQSAPKFISLDESASSTESSPEFISLSETQQENDQKPTLIPLEESSPKIFSAGNENTDEEGEKDPIASFQTDLFHDDDSSNEDEETDDGSDSTMSASMKNHKAPSTLYRSSDNMYTPRPGTSPFYPDRPRFSSKTSVNYHMREFSSNQSEVRVPAPETTPKPDKNSLTPTPDSSNKLTFNFNFTPDAHPSSKDFTFKPSKPDATGKDKFNNFQPESATTVPPLSTTEYQIVSPQASYVTPAPSPPPATTTFHFDFHQLTTPSPLSGGNTGPTYDFQVNSVPDALSKRTFNFDFNPQASASTNSNPFAHILSASNGVTGVIGSASSTGANLGYQNPYNFDTSYSNYNPPANLHIPSGTIPLDLASSYIQAGPQYQPQRNSGENPSYSSSQSHAQSLSTLQDFGFQYNPAPQLDVASIVQNSATSATSNFPSVVTTANNPNAPEYNTITQGIHLLSLLHGNIPSHYSDNQASYSNNNFQTATLAKPEYQIATPTSYGGSSTPFLNNFNPTANNPSFNTPAEGRSLQTYNNNYQPKTESQPSFSQNIAHKQPDFSNVFNKPQSDSLASSSDMRPRVTLSNPDTFKAKLEAVPEVEDVIKVPLPKTTGSSPGSGKLMDMEASSSEIHLVVPKPSAKVQGNVEKPVINFAKALVSVKRRRGKEDPRERIEKGLKSGFFI